MTKTPEKNDKPGKPLVFLFIAAFFVVISILAYVYEDELYIHRPYRDLVFHTINVYFILILLLSLVGAFFCLFAYLNPSFGNRLLGRGTPKALDQHEKLGTVTYSVFADTTASSVKARHRARKTARHLRHKYAKATPKPKSKKKKD